jgi:aryl-alcohol dehydrogenase-like predicted oxidoreductase
MSEETTSPDRRGFLQAAGVAAVALSSASAGEPAGAPVLSNVGPDKIPHKTFGKTKETVSIIGIGGHTLGKAPTVKDATAIAHAAIDAGVTFFDNAWEYHQGRAEEWMGEALKGKRDQVFLMTKVCTHGRGKDVAMQQLEESLKRLKTDHLDLWQIHEVVYYNDPDWHARKGGVFEALDQAKKQGKVRFVGFTGHKHPDIHLKMLATGYTFDSVQMPLNPFDGTYRSFESNVLPEILKRGIAGLGMKSMGGDGRPVMKGVVTAEEALRYAMSLPVAVTISGIDSMEVLNQNLAVTRGFKPMTADEMKALRDRCAIAAGDGHLEMYKSTVRFDGDVGREQHGYPLHQELPI